MSCHDVLEFDEIRILNDLGHKVFCIGSYMRPNNPHRNIRPALKIDHDEELVKLYEHFTHQNYLNNFGDNSGKFLHKEFLDKFDCVIVMHKVDWIDLNIDLFKNKKVILRTIGQNLELSENCLNEYKKNGVKILRYSPKERELPNYAGEDCLIRFLKYKSDFKKRNFTEKFVISFGQNVIERAAFCGYDYIENVSKHIPFKLFGPQNELSSCNSGMISYEQQIEELSKNAAYFYTGTWPAQYTLGFVEAFLSGIPIVSISDHLFYEKMKIFYPSEVCQILDRVKSLYKSDLNEIVKILNQLLNDVSYVNDVSQHQMKVAEELFSVEKNIDQWKNFLNNI